MLLRILTPLVLLFCLLSATAYAASRIYKTVDKYTSISITDPKNDAAIRQNAGVITISTSFSPGLDKAAGHRLQILLDGKVFADATDSTVELTDVDRGTHEVIARIIDVRGTALIISAPVTFHILRYSAKAG